MSDQKSPPQTCGVGYLQIQKKTKSKNYIRFVKLRCKRWDCSICRAIKAKTVQNAIYRVFEKSELHFITVTDMHKTDVKTAWATFGKRWNHLRLLLERATHKFTYIRIIEPHKSPCYPHMHIIANCPIKIGDLKKLCVQAGFGYICDTKKIDSAGAVGYITKYLTKDWISDGANDLRKETRTRIVQASRDVGAIFKKVSDWEVVETYSTKLEMESANKKEFFEKSYQTGMRARLEYGSYGTQVSWEDKEVLEPAERFYSEDESEWSQRRKLKILTKIINDTVFCGWVSFNDDSGNPQDPEEEVFTLGAQTILSL